ncbi:MAG: di-trans,poly-cis-decaprenylcistransferase [Actinobacteria bacterium]|nr:di-trans,poly-cis-decaprenylcistransferase [Actinomycetota bacterium]MSX80365.1 di-trans,poly-cis-decaprenylcistransferase [Actinomycetota bacterium]
MRIVEASEMALVAEGEIPRHVACIMDGNGRWAQMRNLTRSVGHEAAEESVDAVVDGCLALGVKWLTVYAFSTENWKREPAEVAFLMSLQEWLLREEKRQRFKRIGVRLRFLGDLDDPRVPDACRNWLRECEEMTAHNDGLEFCIAFNYGGRAEIVDAVKSLVAAGTPADQIDEAAVHAAMYEPSMPDIDLLIRTSSEYRLSNFFPWHSTYAEFVFMDTLWPDFREGHLYSAVAEFQQRRRRKGSSGTGSEELEDRS